MSGFVLCEVVSSEPSLHYSANPETTWSGGHHVTIMPPHAAVHTLITVYLNIAPENYCTLSAGLVTKELTKKLPGSSLPNSVMPQNLFLISTRHTWPNLALCQVFLKGFDLPVFSIFIKDRTYNFYCPSTSESSSGPLSGLTSSAFSCSFPFHFLVDFRLLTFLMGNSSSGFSDAPISHILKSPCPMSSTMSATTAPCTTCSHCKHSCHITDFRRSPTSTTKAYRVWAIAQDTCSSPNVSGILAASTLVHSGSPST